MLESPEKKPIDPAVQAQFELLRAEFERVKKAQSDLGAWTIEFAGTKESTPDIKALFLSHYGTMSLMTTFTHDGKESYIVSYTIINKARRSSSVSSVSSLPAFGNARHGSSASTNETAAATANNANVTRPPSSSTCSLS